MYQIKRNHVVEDLQLEDNGKTLDVHVDLSIDAILQRYLTAAKNLTEAQRELKKGSTEDRLRALGSSIIELFRTIFGDEQTGQIIDFYGEAYTELLGDLAPFINDVIVPRIQEAQQRILDKYKSIQK